MEKKDEELRQEMLELQMIEERLQSLIERYTLEIEDDTECLKKYKDELENVLKESDCLSEVDNSRICSLLFEFYVERHSRVLCRRCRFQNFQKRLLQRFCEWLRTAT